MLKVHLGKTRGPSSASHCDELAEDEDQPPPPQFGHYQLTSFSFYLTNFRLDWRNNRNLPPEII